MAASVRFLDVSGRLIPRVFQATSLRLNCSLLFHYNSLIGPANNSLTTNKRTFSSTPLQLQEKESRDTKSFSGHKPSLVGTPYNPVDPETSVRYVQSNAYYETYGNDPVWLHYRRNFKGRIPPAKTRKTCIRAKTYASGNPCPICRDDHLVPHHKNVKLLKQFISPYSGQVLSFQETNVCQAQHKKILMTVEQAWDCGYIDMPFPRREYDYKDYYGEEFTKQ